MPHGYDVASGVRKPGGGQGGFEGAVVLGDGPCAWMGLLGAGPVLGFWCSPVALGPGLEGVLDFLVAPVAALSSRVRFEACAF